VADYQLGTTQWTAPQPITVRRPDEAHRLFHPLFVRILAPFRQFKSGRAN